MDHDQNPAEGITSHGYEADLTDSIVPNRESVLILQHQGGIWKRDPVLGQVGSCLGWIPLLGHRKKCMHVRTQWQVILGQRSIVRRTMAD